MKDKIEIRFIRRMGDIENIINHELSNEINCHLYSSEDDYLVYFTESIFERIYFEYFNDPNDNSGDEFTKVFLIVEKFIKNVFGEKIKIKYQNDCE